MIINEETHASYLEKRLTEAKEAFSIAKDDLDYINSEIYLLNLAKTATWHTCIVNKQGDIEYGFFRIWESADYLIDDYGMTLRNVKEAVSSIRKKTGKFPEWRMEAYKMAKIYDTYNKEKKYLR